jgi:hypothetical protein
MDKVIINGEEYRKVNNEAAIKICILQRGWVLVGRFSQNGNDCTLENASVIRRWGTTKGLGEIALAGPTDETILDPCGTARFNYLTTIAILDCEEVWNVRL